MVDIPARDLRNDVSAVLRRVEAGEHLRVTVSGRPVAEIVPLPKRPRSIPWDAFVQGSERWRADPGLLDELEDLLPGTTDDLPMA
jgi:prevent-host-death family protein